MSKVKVNLNWLACMHVKRILNYCKDKDWKIRFTIMKNVWKQSELLSREEHRERIEEIRKELLPLRYKLTSTQT